MLRAASDAATGAAPSRDASIPRAEAVPSRKFAVGGALLLTVLYVANYLSYPALPGHDGGFPLGWWGWFDQSKYLQSARAFADLNFSPAQHWYPLGYALLGAPFVRLMPQHPFFLVDLISLLLCYLAFTSFALRSGVGQRWGVVLFVLAAAADPVLFDQWVVPWNTSPLAAAMWLLLATAAAHLQGTRRPARLGLLAALVPMLRPTDLLIAAVPIIGCLAADLRKRRLHARDVGVFSLAAGLPVAAYCALHLAIYGPHLSEYMRQSRALGFSLHDFGLKAYLILVDPRAWIGGGEGLVQRCPWLILAIAGLVTGLRRPVTAMLGAALIVHEVLYLSYVDLLPTSFWRYHNVHYWIFTFPGFALLGFLWLRDFSAPRTRAGAGAALIGVLILLAIRLVPVPAGPAQPAEALEIPAVPHDFNTAYFDRLSVTDSDGTLHNITQIRAFPFRNGVRILALKRSFHGPASVHGDGIASTAPERFRTAVRWGMPLGPWGSAGPAYGPRR